MSNSRASRSVQICIAVGLIASLGFAAGARGDVPDTGGYVVGNSGDSTIFVYPTGYAPPSGSILGLAPSMLADGNAFYLNDNSGPGRPPVRFYVKKSLSYVDPVGGVPIDISSSAITNENEVALVIAAAINNVGSGLYLLANVSPPPSGLTYLSYNYEADVLSTGNNVTASSDSTNPYPSAGMLTWTPGSAAHNDLQHVQWAINNVATGGTVVLKQSGLGGNPTPFMFGVIGNVWLTKSVTIQGEVSSRAGISDVGSGGWSLSGTRILGGREMAVGSNGAIAFSIKDLIFDGFYNKAIGVSASTGDSEISGCQFINFVEGSTFYNELTGAFPIVVHGGDTEAAIENLGGALKVKNNFFGKPASPTDYFNNLMHFSNGNFNLEISGNEIEDATWAGFTIFGNKGYSRIAHNTITKTKSFVEGAAIAIGVVPSFWFTPYAYNGSFEVTANKITIGSTDPASTTDTYGILIADYPGSAYVVPAPEGTVRRVSGNSITMIGSQRSALACLGACSNSQWADNTVTGAAVSGILLSRDLPWYMTPASDDASVSHNLFDAIDLTGLAASGPYIVADASSSYNVGTDIQVPAGTACSKFILDDGINNVFNAPNIASITANPNRLWPANHKMVPVTVTVTPTDGCGAISCRIVNVSSNQSVDPTGDWNITSDTTLTLRAERLGNASDRIYTITVGCTDERNATTTAAVAVTVPHDQRK